MARRPNRTADVGFPKLASLAGYWRSYPDCHRWSCSALALRFADWRCKKGTMKLRKKTERLTLELLQYRLTDDSFFLITCVPFLLEKSTQSGTAMFLSFFVKKGTQQSKAGTYQNSSYDIACPMFP